MTAQPRPNTRSSRRSGSMGVSTTLRLPLASESCHGRRGTAAAHCPLGGSFSAAARYYVLMQTCSTAILFVTAWLVSVVAIASPVQPSSAGADEEAKPMSMNYRQVQQRLARGWNTWDVNSVATQVLL